MYIIMSRARVRAKNSSELGGKASRLQDWADYNRFRLLAVSFWIAERAREVAERASYEQRGEIGARRKNEKRLGPPPHARSID